MKNLSIEEQKKFGFFGGSQLKKITVIYNFNHSSHGFQNSVTVNAFNDEHAIELGKAAVSEVYGSKMLKRFTFKIQTK